MKKLTTILTHLTLIFLLGACSGYVAKVHRDLDREMAESQGLQPPDHFDQYRSPQKLIQNPRRSNRSPRFQDREERSDSQSFVPRIKRQYGQDDGESRERTTASDFVDNNPSGSLWVDQDQDTSLFTNDTDLGQGDIVLVNVFKKLKNDITLELKRAFPSPPAKKKTDEEGGEEQADREPADDEMAQDETKVYDRISTVIVEEINKNHVLLRGRKNLLYKNRKRLVEVQALVARRDLEDSDTVSSDNIIESSITVLR